jgi:PAS domain S-box-containing protein
VRDTPVESLPPRLRALIQASARAHGDPLFRMVVRGLARLLDVHSVLLARIDPDEPAAAVAVAMWSGGAFVDDVEVILAGSPSELVLAGGGGWYPEDVRELFPSDPLLERLGVRSYLGIPLHDRAGGLLGLVAVLDTEPMADDRAARDLLDLFAGRLAVELELEGSATVTMPGRPARPDLYQATRTPLFCYELVPPMPLDLPEEAQVERFLEARLEECNSAYAQYLGYASSAAMRGTTLRAIFAPGSETARSVALEAVRSRFSFHEWESFEQLAVGREIWALNRGQGEVIDGQLHRYWGMAMDIGHYKAAQVKAAERAAKLAAIFDHSDYPMGLAHRAAHVAANPAYLELFGYTWDQLDGKPVLELIEPVERPAVLDRMQRRARGEPVETLYRTRGLRRDGSSFPMELTVSTYEVGGERFSAVIIRDISDEHRILALQTAELRLIAYAADHSIHELLQELLGEAEALTGSSIGFYHFVEADQTTLALQAWSRNTLAEMCSAEGAGKHYPIEQAGVWVDCVKERAPVIHNDYASLPYKQGLPDGHAPIIRELVVPVFRADRLVAILGVGNKPSDYDAADVHTVETLADMAWEIIGRVRAQAALEREREFSDLLLDTVPAEFLLLSERRGLVRWNRQFEAFQGESSQKLQTSFVPGQSIHPSQREGALARLAEVYGGQPSVLEVDRADPEGRYRSFLMHGSPLLYGQERYALLLAVDITARKQAEAALEQAMDELRELKERIEAENVLLRREIHRSRLHGEIVGDSPPMRAVMAQVERVAATDATVLILGETGTGKELLARAIHQGSARADGGMVVVNCAAIPAPLMEAELFGREKGAYTGALTRQIGRFEAAHGSTLFLDEIGELPLELQAKLLRVLQEGEVERLGGTKTVRVDVRVVAATNRELAKEVAEGRFREDLFYRLNVFPMELPPLRERTEDIPDLVWAFVDELCERMGRKIESIPQAGMDRLVQRPWPGNVRELRNVIERSMILSAGSVLEIALPREAGLGDRGDLELKTVERRHILAVLERTSWRVRGAGGAAELLGLKPTTLESRMKKLGIARSGPTK